MLPPKKNSPDRFSHTYKRTRRDPLHNPATTYAFRLKEIKIQKHGINV